MLIRVGLGIFALAMLSAPAYADDRCGSAPIQPAVPTAAEITAMSIPDGQTKLNGVFKDLHIYQAQLKTYRDCVNTAMNNDQQMMNSAPAQKDADVKKRTADDYAANAQKYNDSVDAEKQLAEQINAAAKAHCARDTSDFCKPKN
ncbi:MAG TPA: hypothetical protein VHL34_08070 [Rhizomicrobium sp.]|nr:hypothetical protein [Rhizomicrobium sp.]